MNIASVLIFFWLRPCSYQLSNPPKCIHDSIVHNEAVKILSQMCQMIAPLRGDTKPLALSPSSFLNNGKGQRKRTLIGIRKEQKKQTPPVVGSISHVACVQTPIPSGKIRGKSVVRIGNCQRLAVIGVMLLKYSQLLTMVEVTPSKLSILNK